MVQSPIQPPSKNFLKWLAVGAGGLAILFSVPKFLRTSESSSKEHSILEWFPAKIGVIANKKTGKIHGWIEGKNNELRFVKMDNNTENKVRDQRDKSKAPKQAKNNEPTVIYVSQKENDVRSEKIFSRDSKYKQFNINARIKYRLREQKMLYRLSITSPPSEDEKCLNNLQEQTLLNLMKEKDNQVRFRFVDADDFWLRDNLMPLNESKANNYKTTVIDSYHKDSCGFVNKLVFHGRLDKFTLPDYSWVEDGKLIFTGVKIVEAMPEEKK